MTDSQPDAEDVVVELQNALRPELKEPLGPIYSDTETLLADAGSPLIAVGDIVTYHLTTAGHTPDVALVDGRTKRSAVDEHIAETIEAGAFDRERAVTNPPATLSAPLLSELRTAIDAEGSTVIVVEGEEDLAALPAIYAAPPDGSVVYGQPDEGMVLVSADGEAFATVEDLLSRMDGDTDRLCGLLDE